MKVRILFGIVAGWITLYQIPGGGSTIVVSDMSELRQAVANAQPGTSIQIAPGDYVGGVSLRGLHGVPGRSIVITGQSREHPPQFVGGSGVQISGASHIEIRDIHIINTRANGLNIDDAGERTTPSHHVVIERVTVSGTPKGNYDGIKLSGLRNFRVINCRVERWGGSAIDMVGCHEGVIEGCEFRSGGDNAVQAKGGSSGITVRTSRFKDFGLRGVNIGGSTGLDYFRPLISEMPKEGRYEARAIRVEGCTFVGGGAPIAFVGVDGAIVRFNTFYRPGRWVIRILQETRAEGFIPCRNGVFEDNLVVFRSSNWASGGVNIGDATLPQTFRFARNFWFCSDDPARSKPTLPVPETEGTYGVDPLVTVDDKGEVSVPPSSAARSVGAHAYRP
jgi:hypothetical protein